MANNSTTPIQPNKPGKYGGDTGLLENIWKAIAEGLFGPIFEFMEGVMNVMVQMFFGLELIETQGPFVLGEPVTTSGGLWSGSTLAVIADWAYAQAWLAEGGPITIAALVLFTLLYVVRGMFDMFQYGAGGQQQKNNFFKGIVLMVIWYPLFLGFIRITHATILTFMGGGSTAATLFGSTLSYAFMVNNIPFVGQIASIITFLPYVLLALIMLTRDLILGVILAFGSFLIAGKYSNLPIISNASDKLIRKTIPIVFLPLPLGPIWYLYENLLLAGPSGAIIGVTSVIFGIVFLIIFGYGMLFAVWAVFKIVAPTLAQAGGTAGKLAIAGGLALTGNASLAYSAARSPMGAAAKAAGKKVSEDGGLDVWNRDGSRGGDD